MSFSNWYSHPYVSDSGYIYYMYYSYPCPESKSWSVLGDALRITIPKIYNAINEDPTSTLELKTEAQSLYDDLQLIDSHSSNYVPKAPKGMDKANKEAFNIGMTEGWDAAANHMLKGKTYAEMRAMYG